MIDLYRKKAFSHAGLLTVARVLRPLSPSNLLHLPDRVVARGRSWSPSSHCGRPGRWNDNRRATRTPEGKANRTLPVEEGVPLPSTGARGERLLPV